MERTAGGWMCGFLGMLIFSASLPATRAAVADLDPLFVTVARAAAAGGLAAVLLLIVRPPRPSRREALALAAVAAGVVVGFPLLTALALQQVTAARSLVFIGLLPLATAGFGVLRGGERPHPVFWLFAAFGGVVVAGFSAARSGVAAPSGDALMAVAVVVCGFGYAEGARLARRLGGWQVICWALVLSLPAMAVLTVVVWPPSLSDVGWPAWAGLAYVSLFSMLIGFVFWYHGLAQGGITAVGQLQLLQPFFGLALAAALLGEPVDGTMLAVAAAVMLCVAGARRFAG